MSKGEFVGDASLGMIHSLAKDYCCMFNVKFSTLYPKAGVPDHPISSSKCWGNPADKKTWIIDNGRIVIAENLNTCCTEQDLFTYECFYDWDDDPVITNLWIYKKGYLPTEFVQSILNLYIAKTELKGVSGKELDYLLSKEMLNSAYGMSVTDIVREVIEYDDSRGYISNYESMTKEQYTNFLNEQINKYNNNPYRFLFYAWGIWVTAYARANLFSGILECGKDYIYSDTDSIKIQNVEAHLPYIERYNKEITKKLEDACRAHGISLDATKPKNKKGEEKPLGVWDFEGVYDEFKTLGAKRYMWRKGDEWQITVAGVNKKSGVQYLLNKAKKYGVTPFDLFNFDLVIPPSDSGRITLTYIDEETSGFITDYTGKTAAFHELSSIHMEPSEYSFNPTDRFLEYLITVWEERY